MKEIVDAYSLIPNPDNQYDLLDTPSEIARIFQSVEDSQTLPTIHGVNNLPQNWNSVNVLVSAMYNVYESVKNSENPLATVAYMAALYGIGSMFFDALMEQYNQEINFAHLQELTCNHYDLIDTSENK